MAAIRIENGAEVYSIEGKKLGKVKHFFSGLPEPPPEHKLDDAPVDGELGIPDSSTSFEEERELMQDVSMERGTAANAPGAYYFEPGSVQPDAWAQHHGASVALVADNTKYMEVHHGGHLHMGGESIYVPFDAVHVVEADGSIVLVCTADEAATRYCSRPGSLDE